MLTQRPTKTPACIVGTKEVPSTYPSTWCKILDCIFLILLFLQVTFIVHSISHLCFFLEALSQASVNL
jgi:hypothetical protein